MKKIFIFALIASAISCRDVYQVPETTLSSYYLIDTVNSIHNAIVAEIDSVLYVVPNYKTMDFNNKDSILKLHNVIRYLDPHMDLDGVYHQYDKDDPYLRELDDENYIYTDILLQYASTINGIKLYSFVFTPENFLLILQTKKVNIIFYIESDGYVSDVIDSDGFVKEYVPVLLPLFSKKDLVAIRKLESKRPRK